LVSPWPYCFVSSVAAAAAVTGLPAAGAGLPGFGLPAFVMASFMPWNVRTGAGVRLLPFVSDGY
jgi:hypothetical protein